MTIKCPHCGKDLPEEVIREVLQENASKAGSTITAKKSSASRINAVKALEGQREKYTEEKRKEAARKGWEKRKLKLSSNP